MSMPAELEPEEAAKVLLGAGLPVLCLDTSSLLNIARLPQMEQKEASAIGLALNGVGSKFSVLLPVQVRRELEANRKGAIDKVAKELIEARQRLLGFRHAAGILLMESFEVPDDWSPVFRQKVDEVIDRLVDRSVTAGEVPAIHKRAWSRVLKARCPSRPGSENMKDCIVVETVLEVMAAARRLGFEGNAVFLSANTEDFGGTRGGKPHFELEEAFAAAGLTYAITYGQARHLLGI